jgi:hypothetical protein
MVLTAVESLNIVEILADNYWKPLCANYCLEFSETEVLYDRSRQPTGLSIEMLETKKKKIWYVSY